MLTPQEKQAMNGIMVCLRKIATRLKDPELSETVEDLMHYVLQLPTAQDLRTMEVEDDDVDW